MDIKYDTECGLVEVPGVLDKKPVVNVIDVDLIPDLGNVNISHLFLLHYRWLPYNLISYKPADLTMYRFMYPSRNAEGGFKFFA